MKRVDILAAVIALCFALPVSYGDYPLIFSWNVRENLRTDNFTGVPHVGADYGSGAAIDVNTYNTLFAQGRPMALMLRDDTAPYSGTRDKNALQVALGYIPKLDYCFADFENPSKYMDIQTMVSQVRNHARPEVKNAYIGNYAIYPGTRDYSQQWPAWVDNSYNDSVYRTYLNVAMPRCYPYSVYIAHTYPGTWGNYLFDNGTRMDFLAPNGRSAMFWAPLEQASVAKRNLPAGHKVIPFIAGYCVNAGYNGPQPSKADLRATVQHYRLRGIDGFYALCYVFGPSDLSPYQATNPNDPTLYMGYEDYQVDMLATWQAMDTYFNLPGPLTILNLQTDKISGVQWSGIQKGNQVIILISNLGNSNATVNYPAISGLPATSPSVAPGTHTLLTYTVNVQTTVQGTVALGGFAGNPATVSAIIEIRRPNFTIAAETHSVTLDANGNYSFTTMLAGTYDLVAKVQPRWLKVRQFSYVFAGLPVVANFALANGDVDGSNGVDATDLSRVLAGLDKQQGDSGYDGAADLDGDNATTSSDLAIVLANQDQAGVR